MQRKPGALRNGAPFLELPHAFRQLQDHMLRKPGGDREMVDILALVVTDAGLLAIGMEPVVVKTVVAISEPAAKATTPKLTTQRAGTKQAMLIAMLQVPQGATIDEIVAASGWQAHSARGAMSGALGKKLGLVVTSAKEEKRGRVYRIRR